MTLQHRHQALAQPPPFETTLVDADRVVGWIKENVIAFRGFGDETEATHAAWIAHRTLARRVARTHGMRLVPIDIEPLALERSHDERTELILASNRPIATLLRPGNHRRVRESFGFELTVPSSMTELELRGVAYLIYRTLRKSGVRWALWRSNRPAPAARVRATADAVAARAVEGVTQPRLAGTLARAYGWLASRLRLTSDMLRDISRGWNPTVYK